MHFSEIAIVALLAATKFAVAVPVEQARDYPVFRTTAEPQTHDGPVYISEA